MLKVGFKRHFHGQWLVSIRLLLFVAGFFPAAGAFAQGITSTPVEDATYGDPYTYNITADGWLNDVVITLETPLPGINLFDNGDGTATLTGAPTDAGDFSVVIRASDALVPLLTSTQDFTLKISKATLVAKANNQTRFYGYNDPTFTIGYTGFKFSDNALGIDTPPVGVATSNDNSSPGNYNINVNVASALDNHYVFVPAGVPGVLTINQAPITITAVNKTKVYGDVNPALTVTYSGLQNGEDGSVLDTQPVLTTTAGTNSGVNGSYPITLQNTPADVNYSISFVPGAMTITKKSLSATANDLSKVYGAAMPALTITYSGFISGDGAGSLDTAPLIQTTASQSANVGSYGITLQNTPDDDNYAISFTPGTLSITKAPLTITADDLSKVYGAVMPGLTVHYSGFVNGDVAGSLDTAPVLQTTASQSSDFGSYPITLQNTPADVNYTIAFVAGTFSVTKAPLTITADNLNKVYGAVMPTLTAQYSGLVNGDAAGSLDTPPILQTTASQSSNFGSYPITLQNTPADINYTITFVAGTLSVTKAPLTITADNLNKVYGAVMPSLSAQYSGFVNGDAPGSLDTPPILQTTASQSSNFGSYPITLQNTPADINYTITFVAGTLSVTKAALTITADNLNKVYGAAMPSLTVQYSGFVNGDAAGSLDTPPILQTTGSASSNVGGYPITLQNSPADVNYTITFVPGSLSITKAVLTATADNKTKPYASVNPALTISYTGFVNGDTEVVLNTPVGARPTISTTAATGSDAGLYDITVSGGLDDNYTYNYVNGKMTITKVSLTVHADAKTRVYGVANPPLTFTYIGFLNGDDASKIDSAPQISTTADINSHVGDYPITLQNGSDNNYDLALVPNTLQVTRATLTITAQDQSKTYGAANPALTVTYSGFMNSDGPSVFTTALSVTTPATTSSPVGTYGIVPSAAAASDYNISFNQGTLTINKAVITARADDMSRPYGSANPTFTISYSGFVNGDDITDISQGSATAPTATVTSNVGPYDINPAGASATNYSFNYVKGTLTVTQATVTITANNATRIYGNAEPSFSPSFSGFLNGQNSTVLTTQPTGTTTATILSDVGSYAINMNGAVALNYTFAYVPGTLTITKATLNAKADDKARAYGVANPTLTISYTGFKNSQSATVIQTPPTATTSATITSNAGSYQIDVAGGTDKNYQFTYQTGTLTIDKAVILATADNKSRTYGAPNPAFTVTYTGLLNGDLPSGIQTPPAMSTDAVAGSPVGNGYTIFISGGSDENYTFNYANGTLTIGKTTLTAKPADKSRTYGAANPVFNVTYTGFVNSETASVIDVQAMAGTTATATSNVGSYDITASGASDGNYDFVYQLGVLTITKATLTLTANNQSRIYGAANPALTITYSGFFNGDTPAVLDAPAPVASTTATATSPVGNYAISISNGTDNNYTYAINAGNLQVTPAALTITADNKSRAYNTANPTFTLSYSGFLNGDGPGSITPPTASTSATLTSPVGNYSINLNGGSAANYTYTLLPGTLTVTKGTPVVTWNAPAAITYGTPLSATQLNASANVAGDFVYTPVSGTVLNAGANQVLSVNFTPTDVTNYNPVNGTTVTIIVNKATPVITWANPASITYGTPLNTTNHLNATANVPGSFSYTPVSGTVLNAGANQTLTANFTPTDAANYNSVTNIQRQITVNKATPVVTWNNPAPITYLTPLGPTQLNATFSVPGTATYVPGAGTILPTGANQVISVNFTPTDAANYNSVSNVQVLITVLKATPVITWSNPADISYGTALTATQLNPTSSVPGSFSFSPPSGTVLPAGAGQTLTASFTPTDATNFNSVPSTSVTINVSKASPVITWANPAAITYGTALSATQLNASTPVAGTFSYNPPLGTVMNAGSNQTITSTFTPTDQANYNTIVTNRTITVNKATPVVTWNAPAPIVYGTPLTSVQQNATATVAGTFEYTPAAGTILNTGVNQTISVKFTPNDITNFNVVLVTSTQITVTKATPVVNWATPLPIKVGVALSATQLNATANVPGTFLYSPASGTSFATEGTYALHVQFTPTDQTNYNNVPDTQVNLVVSSKDNPVITWNDPAAISYGTALSSTQLNASASVPGTYSYAPAAGTKLNAGTSQTLSVTFTPTDQVNYNAVSKSVHINVNKVTLTATPADVSRAYGSSNPSFTINYTGFVNGDAAGVIDTPPTASCSATTSNPAGSTFPITPSGGSDTNYTFAYTNGTLTVTKAPLTATADNKTRTYGVSNPSFTISYSGFANGDDEGDITPPAASTTATINSNVGNYPITLTGGSAANYTITNQPGTLSISKALLVVIGDDLSRPYGQPNPPLTFKYIGFKVGDTEAAIATPPTASTVATAASNVGTYTVTISGGSATNYSLQPFDGSLEVKKAVLTVKADDKTRIYGQSNPTFTRTYTGFVNGDDAGDITAPAINSAAVVTSNAGSYPITLSGGSAANYDLTLQNGTLTVTKATLTAKADNKSRQYGQDNPTPFTITYTGFLNGDDAGDITAPAGSTTATVTSDAGSYPITLTGGTATNYTFALQPGSLSVTPAPLTAKVNDRTRTYGVGPGPNPFNFTYSGFLNGDDVTKITPPTATTVATAASPVGTYAITPSGGSALNYTITLQPGVFTITKATLSVTVDNKTRAYGAANPPNTLTYAGFVNGDDAGDITIPTITGPAATSSSPVGVYPITLSGGAAANYNLDPHNGTLTITKVTLTAKADNKTRVYGAADPAFTITYTGFVNGENASAIVPPLSVTTQATVTSNVGTYPIKITAGTATNYDFTYEDGELTITRAPLTLTANNQSRIYGVANPTLTIAYSGFLNGDTPAVLDAPAPVASTTATLTSGVGNYPITLSNGTDNNYAISVFNGTLSVTKAPLTATAQNKSRPYGSPNPANTIAYSGFKNGETVAVITQPTASTSATNTSPVGTYPITLTGGDAANYQLTLQNGTLAVTQALITVTANNQTRPYGSPNPALTMSYNGFVNGQDISVIDVLPTAVTTATPTSPVSTYGITASGASDNNYTFTYAAGELTINKAPLTATADSKTTTYGTIPSLTITYTGLVNGETIAVLDSKPTVSTTATVTSNPGTYAISITGGSDNNYAINNVAGTMTIGKATLLAKADDKNRIIGMPNPELTITYTGFKNGDNSSVIDVKPTAATIATISSPPGAYTITVTGGSDNHYDFNYSSGTLNVILDNPPVANNFQVETGEDQEFDFTLTLFEANRTDDPDGNIVYVKIVSLPANGTLFRGATRVVAGDEISVSNDELSEQLTYHPNSNYAGNDAFSWNLFDGSFTSANNATITVKITAINDPPVLSNIEPNSLNYSLGDPAITVSEQVIINDIDNSFVFSASVLIATNYTEGDELAVEGGVGDTDIEASYDALTGELKLTGKDTRANYQAILNKVTFSSPVSGEATISEKTITFIVRDSIADSNPASRMIEITEVFPELDIVNSFTPNGDDVNDYWDFLNIDSYSDVMIRIFNKEGVEVFSCRSKDCKWDGRLNGELQPAGPYSYIIDLNNGKRKYKGTVNLLR